MLHEGKSKKEHRISGVSEIFPNRLIEIHCFFFIFDVLI